MTKAARAISSKDRADKISGQTARATKAARILIKGLTREVAATKIRKTKNG